MVTTIDEYSAELLNQAARDLKGLLRPEVEEHARLVQKGLMLFRQRLVYQLRFEGDFATAQVQDVTPVSVRLALDDMAASTCSCPFDGFCRHEMAVFFQALATGGSVSSWVEDWRGPFKMQSAEKSAAALLGLKTARDLLKSQKKLGAEASFEDWTETFSESFESIMYGSQGRPNPYVVTDLFAVYSRRIKADSPVEQEWRYLYNLVFSVQSFLMLAKLSEEFGHTDYMVDRYYRHLFQELIEDAEKAIVRMSISSMPFAFDLFIEKIKDVARALLAVNTVVEYEGIQLYRELWTGLLKKSGWRSAELKWLEELAGENTDDFAVTMGLVHQQLLARRDEAALGALSGLPTRVQPYLLYWLEYLIELKDWKRMGPFVELFVGRLNPYLRDIGDYEACVDFTGMAMDLVIPYCEAAGRGELLERTMVQSLPYSYRIYDSFLFKEGAFTKWVELQAFIGIELDYLDSVRLKDVQKREPAALLPLYHQAIQANIELKNRGSYREAVRQLKKVRTIYKKLGRIDDWERFFELLQGQTKRLRAFQEECVRGKLINA